VRRRPAGRRARDPQPEPHRLRPSAAALVAARLRKDVEDDRRSGTPRNLFGFKDGTANILADDQAALDQHVWVGDGDEPAWLVGGSYLVARKIAMLIETWDRVRLSEQERITGRDKAHGAPLSGGQEQTAPDFSAVGATGQPAIDARSHVRLAPDLNKGIRILRRGYNYVDGNTDLGRLDAACSSSRTNALPRSSSPCSVRCRGIC
jgi:deferrochelatase/peroxidase EfeB